MGGHIDRASSLVFVGFKLGWLAVLLLQWSWPGWCFEPLLSAYIYMIYIYIYVYYVVCFDIWHCIVCDIWHLWYMYTAYYILLSSVEPGWVFSYIRDNLTCWKHKSNNLVWFWWDGSNGSTSLPAVNHNLWRSQLNMSHFTSSRNPKQSEITMIVFQCIEETLL